ncbi:hypothetical protein [Psychroserpens mesophilus]|uniref:hypothetical protein n=1 Tax=Psychroserpens mesophilus TaxID=325473 RepID=UPI00058CAB3D|nr:hypothetical protein [Psychroserpens mesophilus]
MNYLKIQWDDFSFDEKWGKSIWYIEIGEDNYIKRQLEVYENSNRIKFDEDHWCDSYGSLGDQPIKISELNSIKITAEEFESEWKTKALNRD